MRSETQLRCLHLPFIDTAGLPYRNEQRISGSPSFFYRTSCARYFLDSAALVPIFPSRDSYALCSPRCESGGTETPMCVISAFRTLTAGTSSFPCAFSRTVAEKKQTGHGSEAAAKRAFRGGCGVDSPLKSSMKNPPAPPEPTPDPSSVRYRAVGANLCNAIELMLAAILSR